MLIWQRLYPNRRRPGGDSGHPFRFAPSEDRPALHPCRALPAAAALLLLAFCILPGGLAGQARAHLTATARVLHAEPSREALMRLPRSGLESPAVSQTSLALLRVEVAPADSTAQARRRVTIAFVRN